MREMVSKRTNPTTEKRGIWQRTTYTIRGSGSPPRKDSLFSSQSLTLEEQIERRYIDLKTSAIRVLRKAGYPVEPGIYRKTKEGSYEPSADSDVQIGERTRRTKVAKGIVKWPFFPEIAPLSKEEFARELILKCDGMLQLAKAGENPWVILRYALTWANSYFEFWTEERGIARFAETGIAKYKGGRTGNAANRDRVSSARDIVQKLALSHLIDDSKKRVLSWKY